MMNQSDPHGLTNQDIELIYDDQGQLQTIIDPEDNTTTFTYVKTEIAINSRWNTIVNHLSSMTNTTGTTDPKTATITTSRESKLSGPDDPLTLVDQFENVTIKDRTLASGDHIGKLHQIRAKYRPSFVYQSVRPLEGSFVIKT